MKTLQEFLIERKTKLLEMEKRANGMVKVAMVAQLQFADSVLIYLASKQTEEDMTKLQLSLDSQAVPISEISTRRRDDGEMERALIGYADKIPVGFGKEVVVPSGIKKNSVKTKIYQLRTENLIPRAIFPALVKNKLYMKHVTPEELEIIEAQEAKKKAKAV